MAQDPSGGDYSAIVVRCSATSTTHPCTQQALVNAIAIGHKVTLRGRWTIGSTLNGSLESFYLDNLSDQGVAGTVPALPRVNGRQRPSGERMSPSRYA